MSGYRPETYGDAWAELYDERAAPSLPGEVDFLAGLAGAGPVLELGVGTGRVAVPLAERGLEVHGIDPSREMLARLAAKSDRVTAHEAVMDDFDLDREFALVLCVFSTIFAPLTQEGQVTTFACVARHLAPDGVFALQAFVPDLTRFDRGQRLSAVEVELGLVSVEATRVDTAAQLLTGQRVVLSESGTRLYPVSIRYAYPPELDLMARLAGLRLRERWEDYERRPFTAQSGSHVSVYERARP